jgi:hypothetical protein
MMRDIQSFRTYTNINEAKFNKGDVAEVVLGAAMTAKFLKTDDSAVTQREVEQIIREVISIKSVNYTRPDKTESEAKFDEITFKVGIPQKAMDFLRGGQLSEIIDLFQSAIAYVNSDRRLERQSKILRSNAKVDQIIINSDGVGDQKGTKADIKITVNGKQTRNQISLKVSGGDQFAQVSGVGFDKQIALWDKGLGINVNSLAKAYENVMRDFDPGLKFSSRGEPAGEEQKEVVKTAMRLVYQYATDELNKMFKSREEQFMRNLIEFISRGIAGDEQQYIELVKLEKGKFKTIRPGSKAFKDLIDSLDLVAELRRTGDPMITIKDQNTNKPLITVRAKTEMASSQTAEGKSYKVYPRNYIEAPSNSVLYSL